MKKLSAIVCRTWKSLTRAMNCTDKIIMERLHAKSLLICSFITISLTATACWAEDISDGAQGPGFGMEADFNSRYIWQGLANSRGMVMQSLEAPL
jgi:hypothetical protein